MSPMPDPPPVTTAVIRETSKSLVFFRSSFDLAPVAIVLVIDARVVDAKKAFRVGGGIRVRCLSILYIVDVTGDLRNYRCAWA